MKTDFDEFLEEQLRDPAFAKGFYKADAAWDLALSIVRLREMAGLTQKQLAERVGTTQQQISRLESAHYCGHSMSMLRRVADALDATVHVIFKPNTTTAKPKSKTQSKAKPKPKATGRHASHPYVKTNP